MDSFKLAFLFIIVNFANNKAHASIFIGSSCIGNTITPNSALWLNRKTLLSYLSSNATNNKDYYNATVVGINHTNDTLYGSFMCRGDVPFQVCGQCILNATNKLSSDSDSSYCPLAREVSIWYDECMIRYSNHSFFSIVDLNPPISTWENDANATDEKSFMHLLYDTLNQTANEAANNHSIGVKKYATKQARISGFQTLFSLAQCTPDLSPKDCRTCLNLMISNIKEGGIDTSPTFQEFSVDNTSNLNQQQSFFTWSLANTLSQVQIDKWGSSIKNYGTRSLKVDDLHTLYILAQCTPDLSIWDCSTCLHNIFRYSIPWCCLASPKGKVLHPSCYLMFGLSQFYEVGDEAWALEPVTTSPGTKATIQFYNTTVSATSETVYGLFMCRGDVTSEMCQECIAIATKHIASRCVYSKEAVIWYHMCMVRYSNRYFFSTVEEWPRLNFVAYNVTRNVIKKGSYGFLLANTLNDAVAEAANADPLGNKKFATRNVTLPGSLKQKVYVLVQCTPDLSRQDCNRCLSDIMSSIPFCCLGRDGGMVLYPSCNFMYALDLFYRDASIAVAVTPTPLALEESALPRKARLRLISIAMVPILFLLILFFAKRIRRLNELRRYKAILKENFGNESTTLESLQFDFAAIEAATNKFSNDNLIGQGGFGKVYKGTLLDGREVAVKRLSKSSGQDPQKQRLLSWRERYKIIGGIAQAIQYLHEYSRLKIIHRDIKPSNVLLDDKMIPKISDFGMARMVAIDQEQGRTNRVVGTYGYMSPEYAMLGRFSEKSDIFSFGVMVLEIISGEKHSTSYQPYHVDGLLSHVWKQWRDGAPFEILDPSLHGSCSQTEVMKCIQIGLLCVQEIPDDRPLMAEVVSYLSSPSVELPFPCEPAFFIHGGMEINMVEMELELDGLAKNITPFSINEMSISESLPR
ncbi:hypothetical protein TanjilG_24771 [Lupinus angustifolius]|uniref:Cysteine-rich receptor-like protein kinase n=1 Tax=Lupinus angustifolius TaxID=3871 RepID=A0A4P1RLJ4_LUPAN|nr:hypothetical protein TanjilG_24771 [Lupinus angustifolius]